MANFLFFVFYIIILTEKVTIRRSTMTKKCLITLGLVLAFTANSVYALDVFTRNHDVGTGEIGAQVVNKTENEWAKSAKDSPILIKNTTNDGKNYEETSLVQTSQYNGYAYEKGDDGFVYGYAEGGEQGVNETKTMYTDGIGRLHFFGKANRSRN